MHHRSVAIRSLVVGITLGSVTGCSSVPLDDVGTTSAAVCQRGDPNSGPQRDFPETHHTVRGSFLGFWNATDGLNGNGFPLTDVVQQKSRPEDPTLYASQCFERRVMEYHPLNDNPGACNYTVQLALVGDDRYAAIYGRNPRGEAFTQFERTTGFVVPATVPGGQPQGTNVSAQLFPQTNHWVSGELIDAWTRSGGLDINGYPVSGEFMEPDPERPEIVYRTQYFQRVVLQYHPENKYPYNVLGQLVGKLHPRCNPSSSPPPGTNGMLAKMVALHGVAKDGSLVQGCAGVIVGRSAILTAAHCTIESSVSGKTLDHIVVEGMRADGSSRGVVAASLERTTRYPAYKSGSGWEYDLALLHVQGDLSQLYGGDWGASCASKFIGARENVTGRAATQFGIITRPGTFASPRAHLVAAQTLFDGDSIGQGPASTIPFKYTSYFGPAGALKGEEGDCGSPVVLDDGTIAGIYRGSLLAPGFARETWIRLDARDDAGDLGTWWRNSIQAYGGGC